MQVAARGRRLAQRAHELVVDVVDLDRGEAQALEAGRRAGLPDEPRQAIAGGAVAVAAEVDPGEDDLAVALRDAAADLAEHGLGRAAARGAADERDDAEAARERAAVLHLDEGANAVEACVRLHAADRADVARDELRRLLAPARDHDDVLRQPGERVPGEVRAAAGDVDAPVRARRAGRLLARLRDRLVGDAARVDDGHVGAAVALGVAVGEQPLAHRVRVDVRDLAAEEADGERRHGAQFEQVRGPAVAHSPFQPVPALDARLVALEVARRDRPLDGKLREHAFDDVERDVHHGELRRRRARSRPRRRRRSRRRSPRSSRARPRRGRPPSPARSRASPPRPRARRSRSRRRAGSSARRPAGARGRAASSHARRCRRRGQDRSRRRARRRAAPPTAARPRDGRPGRRGGTLRHPSSQPSATSSTATTSKPSGGSSA